MSLDRYLVWAPSSLFASLHGERSEPIAHCTSREAMEAVRRLWAPAPTTFWPMRFSDPGDQEFWEKTSGYFAVTRADLPLPIA